MSGLAARRFEPQLALTPEQLDALTAAAPHPIGPWVVTINQWRLANYDPTQASRRRNHPSQRPRARSDVTIMPLPIGKKYEAAASNASVDALFAYRVRDINGLSAERLAARRGRSARGLALASSRMNALARKSSNSAAKSKTRSGKTLRNSRFAEPYRE